jgi:hypothetical protein
MRQALACWRMLTCADVCWRMRQALLLILQNAARASMRQALACWRMLTYADVCWRMRQALLLMRQALAYWRMQAYADACGTRYPDAASATTTYLSAYYQLLRYMCPASATPDTAGATTTYLSTTYLSSCLATAIYVSWCYRCLRKSSRFGCKYFGACRSLRWQCLHCQRTHAHTCNRSYYYIYRCILRLYARLYFRRLPLATFTSSSYYSVRGLLVYEAVNYLCMKP